MNKQERRNGLIVLLVAFGLFQFAVQTIVASEDPPPTAFAANALAMVVSFLGAGYVARKRGHGGAWAVLGLLNWIGIIAAFCLKDRRKAELGPASQAPIGQSLLNAGFKEETLDRDTHIFTRPWTPPSEPWLAPLLEAGFRNDILDYQTYEQALDQAVQEGERAIPVLLRHLGQAEYVAFALGRIGGTAALEALGKELLSDDWQRAAAAAKGLGLSRDPAAEPHLKRAVGGPLHRTVVEVHQAIESAMNALYKSPAEMGAPEVDRENIWRQIQSIKSRHPDTPEGRRAREDALGLCRAIMRELPGLQVRVPGQDFPPNEAKARAWGCLAPHVYYLLNPDTYDMNRPCPEARLCFEEALKLEPGDSFWQTSISNVSPRPATSPAKGVSRELS